MFIIFTRVACYDYAWSLALMGLQSVGESLHKYSYMQVIINNIRTNQVNIFVTFNFLN